MPLAVAVLSFVAVNRYVISFVEVTVDGCFHFGNHSRRSL